MTSRRSLRRILLTSNRRTVSCDDDDRKMMSNETSNLFTVKKTRSVRSPGSSLPSSANPLTSPGEISLSSPGSCLPLSMDYLPSSRVCSPPSPSLYTTPPSTTISSASSSVDSIDRASFQPCHSHSQGSLSSATGVPPNSHTSSANSLDCHSTQKSSTSDRLSQSRNSVIQEFVLRACMLMALENDDLRKRLEEKQKMLQSGKQQMEFEANQSSSGKKEQEKVDNLLILFLFKTSKPQWTLIVHYTFNRAQIQLKLFNCRKLLSSKHLEDSLKINRSTMK